MCPGCGRVTKIYDAICTRCGTELEFPDVAIAPESHTREPPPGPAEAPASPLPGAAQAAHIRPP